MYLKYGILTSILLLKTRYLEGETVVQMISWNTGVLNISFISWNTETCENDLTFRDVGKLPGKIQRFLSTICRNFWNSSPSSKRNFRCIFLEDEWQHMFLLIKHQVLKNIKQNYELMEPCKIFSFVVLAITCLFFRRMLR